MISDSHSGRTKAIRKVLIGAAWHRCRVHLVRNAFSVIPKDTKLHDEWVAFPLRYLSIERVDSLFPGTGISLPGTTK
ncbi:transposase [Streptomyces erythrochromogenes]|uniref:transposase n=1 Tax=Streptomyces erythrochromogenes TaxID=285574 RepID=UPI0036B16D41